MHRYSLRLAVCLPLFAYPKFASFIRFIFFYIYVLSFCLSVATLYLFLYALPLLCSPCNMIIGYLFLMGYYCLSVPFVATPLAFHP